MLFTHSFLAILALLAHLTLTAASIRGRDRKDPTKNTYLRHFFAKGQGPWSVWKIPLAYGPKCWGFKMSSAYALMIETGVAYSDDDKQMSLGFNRHFTQEGSCIFYASPNCTIADGFVEGRDYFTMTGHGWYNNTGFLEDRFKSIHCTSKWVPRPESNWTITSYMDKKASTLQTTVMTKDVGLSTTLHDTTAVATGTTTTTLSGSAGSSSPGSSGSSSSYSTSTGYGCSAPRGSSPSCGSPTSSGTLPTYSTFLTYSTPTYSAPPYTAPPPPYATQFR